MTREVTTGHSDQDEIVDVLRRFAQALDTQNWPALRACLASILDTDYSSFRGTPPARLAADEFVRLRQAGLKGLITEHTTSDQQLQVVGGEATCRCAFTIRRRSADEGDRRFFDTYGRYTFVLSRDQDGWKIVGITQVAERSEGDPTIHGAFSLLSGT